MLRIYSDGNLLHHDNLENLKVFDPSVELELNKTGSFVFTLYPDHPRISAVNRMKSILQVWQDDFLLFRGRGLDEDVGWHNEKTFSCEGELAFLIDSVQRPYDFSGSIPDFLGMLLSNHNAQGERKCFVEEGDLIWQHQEPFNRRSARDTGFRLPGLLIHSL